MMKTRIALAIVLCWTFSAIGFAQSPAPAFTQYAVKVEKTRRVRVNLTSHKNARAYRTNLRNAAKAGVNFAGHFILTTWGCGTNCSTSAIIDARTGKVFFPDQLDGSAFGFCELPDDTEPIVYKAESRLLVLSGFKGGDLNLQKAGCGIYYLEWTGTKFKQVQFLERKRTDTP